MSPLTCGDIRRVVYSLFQTVPQTALWGSLFMMVLPVGCAKHSDFVELRGEVGTVTKATAELQKHQDVLQRRLQALELGKPLSLEEPSSPGEAPRFRELAIRLNDLQARLGRLEERLGSASMGSRSDEPAQSSKPARIPESSEPVPLVPGTPAISPTSAFNLAYNDYLNGRFDLAIAGFQRFLKDFPSNSLAPNAHYWIGESYFSLKDYGHALQAFQRVVNDYPRSEKVPPALFKLGLAAVEVGDAPKARGYFKRVIEEHSTSDEAKLAKNKLAEIR
jgi:tol-pal system protein YbgF